MSLKKFSFFFILFFFTINYSNLLSEDREIDENVYSRMRSAIVVDVLNGKIIHSENIDKRIFPASLTKIMLLYLIFEHLDKEMIFINDEIIISKRASSMPKSNIRLKEGDKITLYEAILGISAISANDASVAVAEEIFGSEKACIDAMNEKVKMLDMKNTHFSSVNGLYVKDNYSSLRDMSKLVVSMKKKYSKYIERYKTHDFFFRGKIFHHTTYLNKYHKNVYFSKTGFINKSGFNIIVNIKGKDFDNIIGISGMERSYDRDFNVVKMLDQFIIDEFYEDSIEFFKKNNIDFDREKVLKLANKKFEEFMSTDHYIENNNSWTIFSDLILDITEYYFSDSRILNFAHSLFYPKLNLKSEWLCLEFFRQS